MKSQTHIEDEKLEWTDLGGGIRRKIMAHNENMMISKVEFETGSIGLLHHHPHTQASFVFKGIFEITISDVCSVLKAGDVFFVPNGEMHGAICLEKGELIDIFSPRRDDFL